MAIKGEVGRPVLIQTCMDNSAADTTTITPDVHPGECEAAKKQEQSEYIRHV